MENRMKDKILYCFLVLFTISVSQGYAYDYERLGTESDPLRYFRENSPNYNDGYVEDQLGKYQDRDDTGYDRPEGSDIRDYNPYYDRDGNRRSLEWE